MIGQPKRGADDDMCPRVVDCEKPALKARSFPHTAIECVGRWVEAGLELTQNTQDE